MCYIMHSQLNVCIYITQTLVANYKCLDEEAKSTGINTGTPIKISPKGECNKALLPVL